MMMISFLLHTCCSCCSIFSRLSIELPLLALHQVLVVRGELYRKLSKQRVFNKLWFAAPLAAKDGGKNFKAKLFTETKCWSFYSKEFFIKKSDGKLAAN